MAPNLPGVYVRHSVEKDVAEFEGWEKVLGRYERVKREEGFGIAQVYGSIFLTGGRVGEVVTQRPEMFAFKVEVLELADGRRIARDVMEVSRMLLEKRYRKLSHYTERLGADELPKNAMRRLYPSEPDEDGFYERKRFKTERILETRKPFDIPFDEVPKGSRSMHEDLKAYLETMRGQPWLFPSSTRNTHISRGFVWKKFKRFGIYPHYLRGQRASCLISYNGLSMEQMMEWMSWEELRTARHYGKMGKSKLLSVFKRFE